MEGRSKSPISLTILWAGVAFAVQSFSGQAIAASGGAWNGTVTRAWITSRMTFATTGSALASPDSIPTAETHAAARGIKLLVLELEMKGSPDDKIAPSAIALEDSHGQLRPPLALGFGYVKTNAGAAPLVMMTDLKIEQTLPLRGLRLAVYELPESREGKRLQIMGQDGPLVPPAIAVEKWPHEPGERSEAAASEGSAPPHRVYALVANLPLRAIPNPPGPPPHSCRTVKFGQPLLIEEEDGEWLAVTTAHTRQKGWVHRTTVAEDDSDLAMMAALDLLPQNVFCISDVRNAGTFAVRPVVRAAKQGRSRVLTGHGDCLVFLREEGVDRPPSVSMAGLGVPQTIERPEPGALYFYCSAECKFRLVAELLREGNRVKRGASRPSEPREMGVYSRLVRDAWPEIHGELSGGSSVRLINPNDFGIRVGFRSEGRGRDVTVLGNNTAGIQLPQGVYRVYFALSTEKGSYYSREIPVPAEGCDFCFDEITSGRFTFRLP